ncbi:MAG: hypothetical protein M1286_04160 [Candidatus Marsarchaeota archaeon]|nr:hypothetical protein [Candidatus Marsarchaeota archaeon]
MPASKKRDTRARAFAQIFASPFYIAVVVAAIAVYYELFHYLIVSSNDGIFLVTVPLYLIYALIFTASLLFATSVFAVGKSVKARYAGAEGGVLSAFTSSIGGLVVGCSCYAPIFSSVLYAIGFGTLQVSSAISFLGAYQSWFVVVFIAANLIFIYYQLGRIIRIGGMPKRG